MPEAQRGKDPFAALMPAIVAMIPAGAALMVAGIAWFGHTRSLDIQTWPVTEAVVAAASMGDSSTPVDRTTSRSTAYYTFTYEYEGQSYTTSLQEGAGELRYEEGQRIQLHVDPNDPSSASEGRGGVGLPYLPFLLAFGCLLVSLPFWRMSWRAYRNPARATAEPEG